MTSIMDQEQNVFLNRLKIPDRLMNRENDNR